MISAFTEFYRVFTRFFYRVLLVFAECYRVSSFFTTFYRVVPGFTEFSFHDIGFLPSFTEFSMETARGSRAAKVSNPFTSTTKTSGWVIGQPVAQPVCRSVTEFYRVFLAPPPTNCPIGWFGPTSPYRVATGSTGFWFYRVFADLQPRYRLRAHFEGGYLVLPSFFHGGNFSLLCLNELVGLKSKST